MKHEKVKLFSRTIFNKILLVIKKNLMTLIYNCRYFNTIDRMMLL